MPGRRLSQRQRDRIRQIQAKRRQRLSERADQALDQTSDETPHEGEVIARHGASLAVADAAGRIHYCLFRQNLGDMVCGDRVVWQATGHAQGVVTALLPRDSVLSRPDFSGRDKPLLANLSQLVVVVAPEPPPNEYLIDQYLVAAESIGVQALLAVNKIDLLDDEQAIALRERLLIYEQIGYPLLWISVKRPHGLDPLEERLRERTSILVGQSGVGKSSLINALLPERDILVGSLSKATGFGRHTTSTVTSYPLPHGGRLVDSPGVRSFRLGKLTRQELEQAFMEFRPYLGQCRFANCQHDQEPGCALKAAAEANRIDPRRLRNYHQLAAAVDESD